MSIDACAMIDASSPRRKYRRPNMTPSHVCGISIPPMRKREVLLNKVRQRREVNQSEQIALRYRRNPQCAAPRIAV